MDRKGICEVGRGEIWSESILIWPLSTNGPKNNDKKMKWLVEPVGVLVLHDILFEEEREAHPIGVSLRKLSPAAR